MDLPKSVIVQPINISVTADFGFKRKFWFIFVEKSSFRSVLCSGMVIAMKSNTFTAQVIKYSFVSILRLTKFINTKENTT